MPVKMGTLAFQKILNTRILSLEQDPDGSPSVGPETTLPCLSCHGRPGPLIEGDLQERLIFPLFPGSNDISY